MNFTKEQAALFKVNYGNAVALRLEQFEFEGVLFTTSYARHLLKYLEQQYGTSL